MNNKLFKYLVIAFCLVTIQTTAQDKHLKFTKVLGRYVQNGLVNYSALAKSGALDIYIQQLKETSVDTIKNKNNQIAFWLNLYNAYTLKVIIDNYPVESINDLHGGGLALGMVFGTTIWHKDIVEIKNKILSLNEIEHDILREKYDEPRIHFALVCASISCPPLRAEAYEGYKLDEQLKNQAEIFLNNSSKNSFDLKKKEAHISKIFDWFEEDFGDDDEMVLKYITQFLSTELSNEIASSLEEWDVDYQDYNWDLNEQRK